MSAFESCGPSTPALSSPWPGPTATATCPPDEIRLSARSGASAAIAPGGCRSPVACPPCGSAAARDLPRTGEIGVIVDLDPLDGADRRGPDAPAAIGEL